MIATQMGRWGVTTPYQEVMSDHLCVIKLLVANTTPIYSEQLLISIFNST